MISSLSKSEHTLTLWNNKNKAKPTIKRAIRCRNLAKTSHLFWPPPHKDNRPFNLDQTTIRNNGQQEAHELDSNSVGVYNRAIIIISTGATHYLESRLFGLSIASFFFLLNSAISNLVPARNVLRVELLRNSGQPGHCWHSSMGRSINMYHVEHFNQHKAFYWSTSRPAQRKSTVGIVKSFSYAWTGLRTVFRKRTFYLNAPFKLCM